MSVCLLLAVYEWSLPADGCSCVCLAWMCGFRDALEKKKVLKMQFVVVILVMYGMSHSCDECDE